MNSSVVWVAIGGFWCGVVFALRFVETESLHADDPEKRRFMEFVALVVLAHFAAIAFTIAEVIG